MLRIVISILQVFALSFGVNATRGVWFAVSGSTAADSKEGIIKVVNKCKQVGIDTIYFSVWDQSMVNFAPPQSFLLKYPFIKVNPKFEFDPLKILAEEAHAKGIQVFAWFEFGFATTFNDPTGGPILQAKPQWKAIDPNGNLVVKNNFQWMNAFNPEVQEFMIDLIKAALENYEIDGVQGDDRMPALPSIAGYDQYTKALYRQDRGSDPPDDYLNE